MATLPIIAVQTLGASDQEVGMVIGMYLFGSLLSRPVMGRLADIYPKKRILLWTFAFFIIPFILYFFISSIWLLIALRLLHGLAFGALATATLAGVADVVPAARIGEGVGYFATFMTLGMILGPLLGLSLLGTGANGIFTASLCCAGLVYISIISLKLPASCQQTKPTFACNGWRRYIEPAVIPVGLTGGISSFAFSSVSTFITLYADSHNLLTFAPGFYIAMALTVFFSRPLVGRAFDRFGPNIIIQPALAFFALGLLLISFSTSGFTLISTGVVVGLGNGTLFSSLQSLALKIVPHNRQGVATSTFFICFDFCAAAGAFLLGPLAASCGYAAMYRFAAAIVIAGCAFYYIFCQRHKLGCSAPDAK